MWVEHNTLVCTTAVSAPVCVCVLTCVRLVCVFAPPPPLLSPAVPRGYQCGLDVHGVRRDQQERPELRHGSVDFAAPSTFNNRATPQAPIHIFLVDVSYNAVANGSLEVGWGAHLFFCFFFCLVVRTRDVLDIHSKFVLRCALAVCSLSMCSVARLMVSLCA